MPHALVVDDDHDSAASLRELIAGEQFTVAVAHNLRDARRQIALQQPDILLLDLRLPDGNGMDLLADPKLVANSEVVLCTGHANLETSIQALRLGAADYLVKPVNLTQLQGVLSRIMKPAALQAEVQGLTANLDETGHFGHLWGRSPPMKRIYEQISRVAGTSVSVFITGESGTGKEVVAQTVHDLSRRRKRPFLAVNCGAISPNLIESEIFGHEKGSFTGAERQHQGFFERASGGTLFLDEITEMPLELQVKLLRVLETGRFMRVGSTTAIETDVRIVAATNRLPYQAVSSGKLREDLLYRLNIFPIALPPLRDRVADIPLLANHFLAAICEQEGAVRHFTPEAMASLVTYPWPGNVRELRNVVQRAFVMAQGEAIDETWLPGGHEAAAASAWGGLGGPELPAAPAPAPARLAEPVQDSDAPSITLPIGTSVAQAERALMLATLRHYNHHKERTAAVLGISLKTLYNRLKEYAAEGAAPPEHGTAAQD
ncbi:sigma-54-dependent transcriptional regulator [Roseateles puraquae]|uniref:Sigma-54-dependent Fis family transcriptional regulator n=1 Tax=Roseateles puraquae TaxID=431059 RepID=A0A254NDZ3_9BURK|nr:sigma-54 dependent transcriptional regulator [Roseateles puraquae]MDG0854244.1 sigma-54-dependent Fis family transcriptional regulator [Roseateles puraquae]OWR03638.1 sigma-54-dependent Fis family transcriptional regulator [Roseateles puraquae]